MVHNIRTILEHLVTFQMGYNLNGLHYQIHVRVTILMILSISYWLQLQWVTIYVLKFRMQFSTRLIRLVTISIGYNLDGFKFQIHFSKSFTRY